ncbi:MAG: adenylate/guanylate cyclase domain-containing protein, partial [Acidobacteria bacterium]|nr:adenylate/guanylate cyclase domain-containing protein [Acidobacteriota bacterium]
MEGNAGLTFLFTDIEGSTQLWEKHPAEMKSALARHDAILQSTFPRYGGRAFKTVGDAFCCIFPDPTQAALAALDCQRSLQEETWADSLRLRVRVSIHIGPALERDGDYFGPTLNRVARILTAAHGGQTLVSAAATAAIDAAALGDGVLQDLGEHRLKDLTYPEQIFQLSTPDLPSEFPLLRSLEAFAHNLPLQLNSFVGRDSEMADLRRQLVSSRLLTLTGSGGSGKTRLALQLAAESVETFTNGAWFVEIAALSDAAMVPHMVASALHLKEQPARPILDTLGEYLRDKDLLLLLDNCEHLVEACARLVEGLLKACPRLRIMATSREPLGVGGEHVWRVPSLRLPTTEEAESAEKLADVPSVRLFVERASSASPRFTLTAKNAGAIARVCLRLDGIPLAIELAAARIKMLSVEELAMRLDDRFRLLTAGNRTALPRHQTLRAAIDWSYQLLWGVEGVLFRRLSVFLGGFTLKAAETVCGGDGIESFEVLDSLSRLVDKSLVIIDDTGDEPRYRMLESIRDYAREKLEESDEANRMYGCHRRYFLDLAHTAEQHYG